MSWIANEDRMPEAEVALRLAEHLSELPTFGGHVDVAIDGASAMVAGVLIFDVDAYMKSQNWRAEGRPTGKNAWTTTYRRSHATLRIHSRSGQGDVVAHLGGRRLVAECKKGPLLKKKGSTEYPLLTMAIGQVLLLPSQPGDILVAAVPRTPTFRRLAADWGHRPRIVAAGIKIALVGRDGQVQLDLP